MNTQSVTLQGLEKSSNLCIFSELVLENDKNNTQIIRNNTQLAINALLQKSMASLKKTEIFYNHITQQKHD